jgi:3,4-dihydroxy 2-butanone 4-phosphate synthase / GTP cyclohydrolase II
MKTLSEFGKNHIERVEKAIEKLQQGKGILLVDDENRENEGDIIFAAEKMNEQDMALMIRECSGIICLCLTEDKCKSLQLNPMVKQNTSKNQTGFTESIEAKNDITTGVSAKDRLTTIKTAIAKTAMPSDLARPGHVFPLMAKDGGVFERRGHTEGGIDLVKLAGLNDSAVLSELTNEDGTMARLPEIIDFALHHDMSVVTIEDIYKYKIGREEKIIQGETAKLPTKFGDFYTVPFLQTSNKSEHIALVKGNWEKGETVLVRVHSSCATGDIFGSYRCDCGEQLHKSMQLIEKEGKGIIVYLSQEGRGIGLFKKIHAYKLQDEGLDTVEANIKLGCQPDERDYEIGALIVKKLGVEKIRLITNNPDKISSLKKYGIHVEAIQPLIIEANEHNKHYLETKKNKMGHLLELG